MSETKEVRSHGLGLASILTIIFVVAKIFPYQGHHVIDWPWVWVLAPLWISLGIILLILLVILTIAIAVALKD